MTTIYTQMQEEAERIIPGVSLKNLLRNPRSPKRCRSIKVRMQIAQLLRSGNMYLTAEWLAHYYNANAHTLTTIKNDHSVIIE
jgi:hypothetical protein